MPSDARQSMVMIRHLGIRIGEVWSDEEPDETRIDVLRRRARSEPIPDARCVPFHTLLVDLSLEDDELLAAMEKDVRYEIRRASERDGLRVESYDFPLHEILTRFEDDYDRFALDKGLPRANRTLLAGYHDAERLQLTRVDRGEDTLVWHAYLEGDRWVRLLHSVSQQRRRADPAERYLIGRANRYLHWSDMRSAKQSGVRTYDWGGYYPGRADEQKLRINRFKRGFGGALMTTWDCLCPASLRGRLYLSVRDRIRRPEAVG